LLHNHPHLSSGAGTIGQNWLQYKGLSPTQLEIKIIKNKIDLRNRLHLAQLRNQWQALVNTVVNLRVP
jgi:hypothetical protein